MFFFFFFGGKKIFRNFWKFFLGGGGGVGVDVYTYVIKHNVKRKDSTEPQLPNI